MAQAVAEEQVYEIREVKRISGNVSKPILASGDTGLVRLLRENSEAYGHVVRVIMPSGNPIQLGPSYKSRIDAQDAFEAAFNQLTKLDYQLKFTPPYKLQIESIR